MTLGTLPAIIQDISILYYANLGDGIYIEMDDSATSKVAKNAWKFTMKLTCKYIEHSPKNSYTRYGV